MVSNRIMSNYTKSGNAVRYLYVFLFLFLSIVSCSESNGKNENKNHFKQVGEYIEFKLGTEYFKIDKRYFRGGGQSHLGRLQSVEFWALLPDFETYDKKHNKYEFVDRLGWGKKVYFSMYLSSVRRNSVSTIVNRNSEEGTGFAFSGRVGEPDNVYHGIEVYDSGNYQSDIYLSRSNGTVSVYISCTSKVMKVPSPSCRMMWDLQDSVYADATFSKDYLSQWKAILVNIQKIYNGQSLQGK